MHARVIACVGLLPLLAGCKGEPSRASDKATREQQACRNEAKLTAEWLGMPHVPVSDKDIAGCVEALGERQVELGPERYPRHLDCKIAATDFEQSMRCDMQLVGDALVELEAEANLESREELDAALVRLEPFVQRGSLAAETLAMLREPGDDVPRGRVAEVAHDAAGLLETGRVGSGQPLAIRLQPGIGSTERPNPVGLEGAELVFVDADSGLTVGRLAPLSTDHLGAKDKEVAALLTWMLEAPDVRTVELVVTTSTSEVGIEFEDPAALSDSVAEFDAAGVGERPILWLDGTPMTLRQWSLR